MIKHGLCIWEEADPGARKYGEDLGLAWGRLFNETLDFTLAIEVEELQSGKLYRMPNGYVALDSYPGGCAIYRGG